MFHNIFGGIRLDSRKDNTRRKSLAVMDVLPEQVILPVATQPEEDSVCHVAAGDVVTEGQPIACTGQGVVVHANISGQVEAVEPRPHPGGAAVLSVVIRGDGREERWAEHPQPVEAPAELSAEEIISRVEQAGVIGMVSGCPTGDKLRAARGRVDTVIVNATESEPTLSATNTEFLDEPPRTRI